MGTPTRVPQLARPIIKGNPELQRAVDAIIETMEVREGRRGNKLDRGVTFRDLTEGGIAKLRPGGGAGGGGLEPAPIPDSGVDELPDMGASPPVVDCLRVVGSLGVVFVTWCGVQGQYRDFAYHNVYRATTNDFGATGGTPIGTALGSIYVDHDVSAGVQYCYWVTAVGTGGEGPINATEGTCATVINDPGYLLDLLEGEIQESHLFSTLGSRINLIDADASVPGSVAAGLLAEANARASELAGISADLITAQGTFTNEVTNWYSSTDLLIAKTNQLDALVNELIGVEAWDALTQYALEDLVAYDDKLWRANAVPAIGAEPGVDAAWTQVGDAATLAGSVAAHSATLTEHDARITNEAGRITSEASRVDGLVAGINSDIGDRPTSEAVVGQIDQAKAEVFGASASTFTGLTATFAALGDVESMDRTTAYSAANLITTQGVITAEGVSKADNRSVLTARLVDEAAVRNAQVVSLEEAVVTEQEARATAITQLESSFQGQVNTKAAITYVDDVIATEESARATMLSNIQAEFGNNVSGWTNFIIAETDAHSATASKLNTLTSQFGGNEATALSYVTTHVDTNSALASDVSQLSLDVDGVQGAVETKAEVSYVDGVFNTQYTVKLDNNGLVSGFGLMNTGQTSSFGVRADKFWIAGTNDWGTNNPNLAKVPFIVRPVDTYSTEGVFIPAGTYIRNAIIENGAITTAKIENGFLTNLTADKGMINSALVTNAEINQGFISGDLRSGYADRTDPNNWTWVSTFVPGSTGWIIRNDGAVEFNNGTFRGHVVMNTGQINALNVVDTLQIRGNAVMVPQFSQAFPNVSMCGLGSNADWVEAVVTPSLYFNNSARVMLSANLLSDSTVNDFLTTIDVQLRVSGVVAGTFSFGANGGYRESHVCTGTRLVSSGYHTFSVWVRNTHSNSGRCWINRMTSLTVMGVKR